MAPGDTPACRLYTLQGYLQEDRIDEKPFLSTTASVMRPFPLHWALSYGKIRFGVDTMRILGIDPGVATIGFGVVDSEKNRQSLIKCGVITTPAHTSLSSRLEQMFFNTNITTGIAVAHARGVILLACRLAGVEIFEYTPLQVKQSVVGYGRAEKKQVMDMVKRLCNLPAPPKPDDAADAVALALCHARSATSLLNRGGSSECSTT